jgi:hypothetical protein
MERIQLFALLVSLVVSLFIFELVRKRKLMEKYSLVWIISALILTILSIWRDLLEGLADVLGIFYAPTALFIVLSFCGMGMLIHFSIVISKLTEQNKILAQEIALMKYESKEKQRSHGSKKEKTHQ